MKVETGMSVNAEALTAWEQASQSLRGNLHRVGLSPGSLAALVLALFALGIFALSPAPARSGEEWSEHWTLDLKPTDDLVVTPVVRTQVVQDEVSFTLLLTGASTKPREPAPDDPLALDSVPPSLVVRDRLFDNYALILNKFPVLDGHALLVTRDFAPQGGRITKLDLDAFHRCVTAAKAIGFYNSHAIAGSSQPHRHFQLVPLASWPAAPGIFAAVDALPHEFWRWNSKAPFFPHVVRLPFLVDVAHGLVRLPSRLTFAIDFAANTGGFADALLRSYVALATDLAILDHVNDQPHNILLAEHWILVVKRQEPAYMGISVNGLAFSGTLVVRDAALFDQLRNHSLPRDDDASSLTSGDGPLAVLTHVAVPASSTSRGHQRQQAPPGASSSP